MWPILDSFLYTIRFPICSTGLLAPSPPSANFLPRGPILTGSKKLDTEWGAYPLNLAIIGGKWLSDDPGFIVTMVEPEQLGDLAAALIGISEEQFTDLYRTHCKDAWPEYGEEDLEYNREYFHAMREFYARVAPTGRSVVFSADQ